MTKTKPRAMEGWENEFDRLLSDAISISHIPVTLMGNLKVSKDTQRFIDDKASSPKKLKNYVCNLLSRREEEGRGEYKGRIKICR